MRGALGIGLTAAIWATTLLCYGGWQLGGCWQ